MQRKRKSGPSGANKQPQVVLRADAECFERWRLDAAITHNGNLSAWLRDAAEHYHSAHKKIVSR